MSPNRFVTLAILSLLAGATARAQSFELGVTGGAGSVGAEDITFRTFGVLGVEACALCRGHYAVFGEYSHWMPGASPAFTKITTFDSFAGGLRIQAGRRFRPFFDIGIAGGRDQYDYLSYQDAGYGFKSGVHTNLGMVLGGGVTIRLSKHLYVRPQFRTYALRGLHVAAWGGAGFGIRF